VTVIKILLILAVLALAVLALRQHGTNRGSALAKLGMAAFLLLAAYAVIRPQDVTWLAERLGVGRGTDLVLYLLVVGFGFFAVTTYLRFKQMEAQLAALARRFALDEAVRTEQTWTPAPVPDPTSGPAPGAPRG
jgi:hypothetical protein